MIKINHGLERTGNEEEKFFVGGKNKKCIFAAPKRSSFHRSAKINQEQGWTREFEGARKVLLKNKIKSLAH
jgi:hypothetical protein